MSDASTIMPAPLSEEPFFLCMVLVLMVFLGLLIRRCIKTALDPYDEDNVDWLISTPLNFKAM